MSAKGRSRARIAPPLGVWGSLSAKGRSRARIAPERDRAEGSPMSPTGRPEGDTPRSNRVTQRVVQ
jgi:hypothetical protein